MVGIFERELKIWVKIDDYVCLCFDLLVIVNLWFYLGFSWKDFDLLDGGFIVYIDGRKVGFKYVRCERRVGMRFLFIEIELGLYWDSDIVVEYDNLVIWY